MASIIIGARLGRRRRRAALRLGARHGGAMICLRTALRARRPGIPPGRAPPGRRSRPRSRTSPRTRGRARRPGRSGSCGRRAAPAKARRVRSAPGSPRGPWPTAARSRSAISTPGSSWSSLAEHLAPGPDDDANGPRCRGRPRGRRPGPAARTKAPVSMARARSSISQCASPVGRVKAAGTVITSRPGLGQGAVEVRGSACRSRWSGRAAPAACRPPRAALARRIDRGLSRSVSPVGRSTSNMWSLS